ncbi:MarR family transcriptional regulator [Novosphingobium sp.]|jgi:DNA-binding MarR family transcriptional regulator|uniref:MarR family winged helix-turn-helix transcriptional regulator n=1 Tax=Novosphingobium sp. TaxID=1874826 RepID=UPI001ED412F1|nr:MarR family transcriptional regulator [Novosphingobium sp.]MBK6803201.1 MarR family transcriptional regulator [Novosphingobium sp.]MBK9011948.1 MarR family transcriptional regulator [Novosphingobium sp.]
MSRRTPKDLYAEPAPPGASVRGMAGQFSMGVLDELLNFRMRRIRNCLTEKYRRETLKMGQRAGAFSILALIDANPGIAQIDLARFAGYDQTALVGIIDDMESKGWTTRTRDPADRRRHQVQITDAGREALAVLTAAAIENEREAREALSPEELEVFRIWLDRIYRKLL